MKKGSFILNLVILFGIIVIINIFSSYVYDYIDLTEDKRYTMTEPTLELLEEVDDIHFIQVFLDGTFPAGIRRFRDRVEETIKEFQSQSPYIKYEFLDPLDGTPEDVQSQQKILAEMGLLPTTVSYFDGENNITKPMYPYALLSKGDRKMLINLLNVEGMVNYDDETLNAQESQLEYRFADGFQKLANKDRQVIVYSDGNGELESKQTAALTKELRPYYDITRINLDTIYQLTDRIDLLIMAGPEREISARNQFILDQYIMNGGRVIWLIESLATNLDSISKYVKYVPPQIETGLDNMFFKYGFRIQDNLIADLEATRIPQVVSNIGGKPQINLFRYYYHLLISPTGKHPIVKNIDRVNMFFPSTIDSVNQQKDIKKEVLLSSSKYSRYQLYPITLDFDILREKPDISNFNKGDQPVGMLLEGNFESAFKNRLTEDQEAALQQLGTSFKDRSPKTAMIVFSDVDFIKNKFDPNSNNFPPIGYNSWEKNVFNGNKELILNSIEYLLDRKGILLSRAKEYKLRMLDEYEVTERKAYWQSLNIGVPLVTLVLFGLIFNLMRKRKYSKKELRSE